MKIKNKKGVEFEVTEQHWNNAIVAKGNAYKYQVTEDDAPAEIKQLRQLSTEKKKTNKK